MREVYMGDSIVSSRKQVLLHENLSHKILLNLSGIISSSQISQKHSLKLRYLWGKTLLSNSATYQFNSFPMTEVIKTIVLLQIVNYRSNKNVLVVITADFGFHFCLQCFICLVSFLVLPHKILSGIYGVILPPKWLLQYLFPLSEVLWQFLCQREVSH